LNAWNVEISIQTYGIDVVLNVYVLQELKRVKMEEIKIKDLLERKERKNYKKFLKKLNELSK